MTDPTPDAAPESRAFSRRSVLFGAGGLMVGAAGGALAASALSPSPSPSHSEATADAPHVEASGAQQAGVARPATPQQHALFAVHDLGVPSRDPDLPAIEQMLADLGTRIRAITHPRTFDDAVTPDGPGDLVVSIGLGPRVLAAIDPTLPGAEELPPFRGDDAIDPLRRGGDLLIAVHASDAMVLPAVLADLEAVGGGLLRPRWSERGFRSAGEDGISRNPLGFLDGVRVPRGDEELAKQVWISPDDHPRAAGGTVVVLRRLALAVDRFRAESPERQDAVFGRHRVSGAPLSGGELRTDVDLMAKTPQGEYLVPARSHARAAHPSFTGSHLMLRRPYAFRTAGVGDQPGETGMFFISYQRDLATFARTQLRLDETDDLMAFVTPTGSASFLILPGHDERRPLGSTLFA